MQGTLSFENTPPLWLPLSFFLAAPCWLLVFAAEATGLAPGMPSASPLLLALTHTLALGVLGNVMLGALFQILSVLSGIGPRHPTRWLHGIFWPFQSGCALLVSAFLSGFTPWQLTTGGSLLAGALLVFGLGFSLAAIRSRAQDPSTRGIRLALLGLCIAAALGWTLTGIIGRGWALNLSFWLPQHIAWASNGWLLMLLMSVALTVVPMFQITAPYPPRLGRILPWVLFMALLLAAHWLVALAGALFLLVTLRLELNSKRSHDVSRRFWLASTSLGLAAILLWASGDIAPGWLDQDLRASLTGWLWLAGLGLGSICAMLYKIIPFLIWLHLKASRPPRGALPSMQAFIGERETRHTLWCYGAWIVSGVLVALAVPAAHWGLAACSAMLGTLLLLHCSRALYMGYQLRKTWP